MSRSSISVWGCALLGPISLYYHLGDSVSKWTARRQNTISMHPDTRKWRSFLASRMPLHLLLLGIGITWTAKLTRLCNFRKYHRPNWILEEEQLPTTGYSKKNHRISCVSRSLLPSCVSRVPHPLHHETSSSGNGNFNDLRRRPNGHWQALWHRYRVVRALFPISEFTASTCYQPLLRSLVGVQRPDFLTSWSTRSCFSACWWGPQEV